MYQLVVISGNLGQDPEMRYLPDGTAVTNLSVAVNDNYTAANGEKVERHAWFRVSVWGKQAEAANQYLEKGRAVLVEGTLTYDPETHGPKVFRRNDGTAGASFEVRAKSVKFIGGRTNGNGAVMYDGDEGEETSSQEEDEIPF